MGGEERSVDFYGWERTQVVPISFDSHPDQDDESCIGEYFKSRKHLGDHLDATREKKERHQFKDQVETPKQPLSIPDL